MKKLLIALILIAAAFMALPSVAAGEVCSAPNGGCPASCMSQGATCYPKPQTIPAPNVPGKELTCVKQKNVGCGFFLEFPPVRGNDCPADMTHDDAIDGETDCGFLGLGALLGDGKSVCHQNVDVACKVGAKCPSGTKPKPVSEKSCFVSTGQATSQVLQCCITSSVSNSQAVVDDTPNTAQEVIDARNEFATTLQILDEQQHVILTPGQNFTFAFFAKTDRGEIVTNKTVVKWSLLEEGNYADSTIDEDTGELTVGANARGNFRVKVQQIGGFEKPDFADVTVVNFHDFSVAPPVLNAEVGARVLFHATALEAITDSQIDVPAAWSAQGAAIINSPSAGTSDYRSIVLFTAGSKANVTATASSFTAKSQVSIVAFNAVRVPASITLDAGNTDMTVGSERVLGVLIQAADGTALASSRATFSSSDANIVRVSNNAANPGVLTAVSAGEATITVRAGVAPNRVEASIVVNVIECQADQTDESYCQRRVNFDVEGPKHQTCVEGKWDNVCVANTCTAESRFACVVNNAPGMFTCNIETGNFENCEVIAQDAPNAPVDASSLDGAICSVSLLSNERLQPSLRDRIAQLASNPAAARDVEGCELLGVFSEARECITQPRDVVLNYHFEASDATSTSDEFEIGHWRYAVQDASTGDAQLVKIMRTNLVDSVPVESSFYGEGAQVGVADPSTSVVIRSIETTLNEDSSVDSVVTFRVIYNSCKYAAVFPE